MRKIVLLALLPLSLSAQQMVMSPHGDYRVSIDGMSYSVIFRGDTIIRPSRYCQMNGRSNTLPR